MENKNENNAHSIFFWNDPEEMTSKYFHLPSRKLAATLADMHLEALGETKANQLKDIGSLNEIFEFLTENNVDYSDSDIEVDSTGMYITELSYKGDITEIEARSFMAELSYETIRLELSSIRDSEGLAHLTHEYSLTFKDPFQCLWTELMESTSHEALESTLKSDIVDISENKIKLLSKILAQRIMEEESEE